MEGAYGATSYANGIFKINVSTLAITEKWGYSGAGRLKSLVLNSSGSALYAATNNATYGLVFIKINTSNLGVAHSTYLSFSQSQQGETSYDIALDATETNISLVGVGYFTFSGFTQNWPLLFSVKADGTSINWNRLARASNSTTGYLNVQMDSSGNTYVVGDLYNGTIWKKQLLKVSPANSVLFSNAFDGTSSTNNDISGLAICNPNSTIKRTFNGSTLSGVSFHSLPTDGTATGTYVLGSDTYVYGTFTPTYYSLSPFRGNASINIVNPFNNYATATASYTFPSITVALPKKDIP